MCLASQGEIISEGVVWDPSVSRWATIVATAADALKFIGCQYSHNVPQEMFSPFRWTYAQFGVRYVR
jgi:hypothetical protein